MEGGVFGGGIRGTRWYTGLLVGNVAQKSQVLLVVGDSDVVVEILADDDEEAAEKDGV